MISDGRHVQTRCWLSFLLTDINIAQCMLRGLGANGRKVLSRVRLLGRSSSRRKQSQKVKYFQNRLCAYSPWSRAENRSWNAAEMCRGAASGNTSIVGSGSCIAAVAQQRQARWNLGVRNECEQLEEFHFPVRLCCMLAANS